MPSPRNLPVTCACSLMVVGAALASPLTRSGSGWVRTADGAPVANTKVIMDPGGSPLTSDSGKFDFPFSPPLRPGYPVTFAVEGWVIIDPCVLERGRIYLPDPDIDTIKIKVLRPGDRRLLLGNSIGCLVEERASRFEPKLSAAHGPGASLSGSGAEVVAGNDMPVIPEWGTSQHNGAGHVTLAVAAYRTRSSPDLFGANTQEHPETNGRVQDQFLAKQAKELGFTTEELAAAIAEWANLADLYRAQSRYAEAEPLYKHAVTIQEKVLRPERRWELARNLINFAQLYYSQGKYGDAQPLCERALAIDEATLGPEQPQVASDLNNLAEIYRAQERYAEADPSRNPMGMAERNPTLPGL